MKKGRQSRYFSGAMPLMVRVDSSLSVQASLGVDVYRSDKINSRLQINGANLNNRLSVIDFGGLFSGNAIGAARGFALRLNTVLLIAPLNGVAGHGL
jgi:hypothetical protein